MKIGLLTGGGDCPGLNPAIRAVVKCATTKHGMQVTGILDSFNGLFETPYRTRSLGVEDVHDILARGGTILGTHNKGNPFESERAQRIDEIQAGMQALDISALIAIGGEGTQGMAAELDSENIPVIGIPKTIDNDLPGTERTIGFASCVDFVAEAVQRLRSTAESHDRIMVIEVMGRDSGYIALHGGIAGGANVILIPEIPFNLEVVSAKISDRKRAGRKFSVVVVSEGAHATRQQQLYIDEQAANKRLGGIGDYVACSLNGSTGIEARVAVLGHLQRGGIPSATDRILASRFAVHACHLAAQKDFGRYVIFRDGKISDIPYRALEPYKRRRIGSDDDVLRTAQALNICVGR